MTKYDCRQTRGYSHELNRMHEFYIKRDGCCDGRSSEDCPLSRKNACLSVLTIDEERIAAVQAWSDEHPEKTNFDALKEVFPGIKAIRTLPCELDAEWANKTNCGTHECRSCIEKFWNAPYHPPEK